MYTSYLYLTCRTFLYHATLSSRCAFLIRLQIGHQHGTAAKIEIDRCIQFYAELFKKNCKQDWPEVLQHAEAFEQIAKAKWPAYHEEMRGIADGSGADLLDIVALNVRTEINFGMFSDGCTALSWQTEKRAYLAQNWDVSSELDYTALGQKLEYCIALPGLTRCTQAFD
jgi:hypothetical protein